MLSYQHAYHAGNLADIHKHAVLAWILDYMAAKPKPMTYIETHAGRGLYDLSDEQTHKTGEAAAGILHKDAPSWFADDHPLSVSLAKTRAKYGASAYPGSPMIAAQALRLGDQHHLAELHPAEFIALQTTMAPYAAQVYKQDGEEMVRKLCPPTPGRGLVLIDPSYEIKSDFERFAILMKFLQKKWAVGVKILWYPILTSAPHLPMVEALSNLPGMIRHEVSFAPAREGHRMIGSGLVIINPPYGFEAVTAQIDTVFENL